MAPTHPPPQKKEKICRRNELNVWAQTCREVIWNEANGNKQDTDKGSLALKQESVFVGSI